jgi:hypothetical protein
MGLHAQQANPETQPDHPNPLWKAADFSNLKTEDKSKLSLASPQRLVYCLSYIIMSELYPSVAPSLFANR